ncbi:unnamed protein product [Penicillium discolor]
MPYKPRSSKGCGNCRTRRIRCDTARPTCSQCKRARFSCPGYRDPHQLQFRNESPAVRARVDAENQLGPVSHSKAATLNNLSPLSVPSPLSESIRDESVRFFFRYYVLNDLYDIPIHPSVSQMADLAAVSPAVSMALAAVGLASLSNIRKSAGLMAIASREYTEALSLTGTALSDPTSDATLAAVLLLSMFEVLTCRARHSLDSWLHHTRGAMTLVEMRGAEQIRRTVGMRLFTHLRVQIITSCLHWHTPVPASLVQWSSQAMSLRSVSDAKADELVDLIARVSEVILYAETQDDIQTTTEASCVDRLLFQWRQNLPPRWAYGTAQRPPARHRNQGDSEGLFFDDTYHIYPDAWACNILNFYRTGRILLNRLIHVRIQKNKYLPSHPTTEVLSNLAMEIAQSVPYALRQVGPARAAGVDLSPSADFLGGFITMWPLYVAADVSALGSALREWAIERLEVIGNCMGIGKSQFMARILRSAQQFEARLTSGETD